MKTVNYFDAYLRDCDDRSIQFAIICPTDDPGPDNLLRILDLIFGSKVYFRGGECDSDYFEQEL